MSTFVDAYPFVVSILAIGYSLADLSLLFYLKFRRKRADTETLSSLIGVGPARTFGRVWYVHSAQAMRQSDPVVRFLFVVLRVATLPAFFGMVALFIVGVSSNTGP